MKRALALSFTALVIVSVGGCAPMRTRDRGDSEDAARSDGKTKAEAGRPPEREIPPSNWFMAQRMTGGDGASIPVAARARALSDWMASRRVPTAAAAGVPAGGSSGTRLDGASGTATESAADAASPGSAPGSWVNVGPRNIGGRITALAAFKNNVNLLWLGAAEGGVWKSTDGGSNWTPTFDAQTALSIGAIATHPTDQSTVYVGTGEDNGAGYSYDGEGVLKTTDGGNTWTNMGLAEVRRIGRIAVDPSNPQRVFVAAGGSVFTRDANRGVYRSTDGGATWTQVLFVANDTGAIDVVIDPSNTNRIYAAMWTRYSTTSRWVAGGVGSGIYQSTDGGTTWTHLTNGLPASSATVGRIGLALAASAPATVYAIYRDDPGNLMGIWKTTNSGSSWARADSGGLVSILASYGYYFGQIRVDPANANTVYVLDVNMYKSTNAAVNFNLFGASNHSDHHDLLITSMRTLNGTDGGLYTLPSGTTIWTHNNTLPISQFYDIGIDRIDPTHRFGGLQDNNTVKTPDGGSSDWTAVIGGDGFQAEVDPNDSSRVYGESQYGNIERSTDGGVSFVGATSGINPTERTNWNAPVTHDPVTSQKLYTGTTVVYRSTNGAASWSPISPDLTNGVPVGADTDPPPNPPTAGDGGSQDAWLTKLTNRYEDHLASVARGTITAIGVSPVDQNILWAGTDDGNIWVTSNGGTIWTKVNALGITQWITNVKGDPFDAQTAYATLSGYRAGSYLPHIIRTKNLGQTWTDITGDLPQMPIDVVTPDPTYQGRLYIGNDIGIFLTDDGGVTWSRLGTGVPNVVVMDLYVHQATHTLYAATHGRSMYTYDLTQLPPPDRDGDGVLNVLDCAPDTPGVWAVPNEVSSLTATRGAGESVDLSWPSLGSQAGTATVYDVLRGDLVPSLPVGSAGESCFATGIGSTSASDTTVPAAGTGFRYLVRGRNACGSGIYGHASDSSIETSGVCP